MTLPLDLLMFAALVAVVLTGFPVAFGIAGVAVLFAALGALSGVMDFALLGALSQRAYGLLTNDVLIAIPLFVFMGALLEKSRIAEELLDTMGRLFGQLRGGLGIAVVLVGALLAASTGIVGATVVAMGLIALPTMLRVGYDPRISCGIVCTAGTLGQIIPPSTLLIILADVLSNAFQQAQYAQGKFSIETLSVGELFAAALIPGLVLVILYLLWILLRGLMRPQDLPPARLDRPRPSREEVLRAVLTPILLIIAVLGSILAGIATPTEAAAVGAIGALFMAGLRAGAPRRLLLLGAAALILLAVAVALFPVRLQRSDLTAVDLAAGGLYLMLTALAAVAILAALRRLIAANLVQQALDSTLAMTAMIFATILAAGMFSLVFVGLGGEERVVAWLEAMPGGPTGALIFAMLVVFVLGFFLDFVEIAVIVLPVALPALILMGHDPIWLGVLFAINLQTSFLTPPFGFSLFYLRGAAPPEVTTGHIYRGVLPFIALQAIGVLLVWLLPPLATWLPNLLF